MVSQTTRAPILCGKWLVRYEDGKNFDQESPSQIELQELSVPEPDELDEKLFQTCYDIKNSLKNIPSYSNLGDLTPVFEPRLT